MLFHALADPEAGHYIEQFVCRLRGELDIALLGESWHRVVARHSALRSTLHWTDFDHRFQVVHRRAEQPLDYEDWRELKASAAGRATRVDTSSRTASADSIPLPPLSRLAVLRLGDDVHQLIWSIHHVVIDGWCLSVLLHEMLDIYESLRQRRDPVLKPSRPFRDYVAWLHRQADDHAEVYWRQAFEASPRPHHWAWNTLRRVVAPDRRTPSRSARPFCLQISPPLSRPSVDRGDSR